MRPLILIILSTAALIALLFIQISWIMQSAELKEELFNQRTAMALSRTVENLCSDEAVCKAFRTCLLDSKTGDCKLKIGMNERFKLDSLLQHYFKLYDIHLQYKYDISQPDSSQDQEKTSRKFYSQSLEGITNGKNVELKLFFPGRQEFVFAEIGGMFIASVVFILAIITFFWLSLVYFKRERRIYKENKDFINTMTHELKTPITNISLAGNFLFKKNSSDPADNQPYIEIIRAENLKLNQLVDRTLSLSQLENEGLVRLRQKVDLHEVIRLAVKNVWMQLQEKGANLSISLEASLCIVSGDQLHLAGVFCNLLQNAGKYAGPNPRIEVSTRNLDQEILVAIRDNGPGIDASNQERVFNDFFRLDGNSAGGYGLGLAYAKKVITLHHGKITLQNNEGQGSCFEVILPVLKHKIESTGN